jgi:hypothetical protein
MLRAQANTDPLRRGNRDAENLLSVRAAESILSNTAKSVVLGALVDDRLVRMVSVGWSHRDTTLFGLF